MFNRLFTLFSPFVQTFATIALRYKHTTDLAINIPLPQIPVLSSIGNIWFENLKNWVSTKTILTLEPATPEDRKVVAQKVPGKLIELKHGNTHYELRGREDATKLAVLLHGASGTHLTVSHCSTRICSLFLHLVWFGWTVGVSRLPSADI
jgi:hypothetical protein